MKNKQAKRNEIKSPFGEYVVTVFKNDRVIVEANRFGKQYKTVFRIGDKAEYDSYNLSYIGEITAIGEKTVTITAYKGSQYNERKHMLKLDKFAWRNYNFDLAQKNKENAEISMYI